MRSDGSLIVIMVRPVGLHLLSPQQSNDQHRMMGEKE